jgi:UDP-3-O-[3-hydroxymyristoyl] glucosamine N-acyltransferase
MNFIDPTAKLGKSVVVWHFARVLAGAELGDNVSVGSGAEVGRNAIVGKNTRIGANVFIPANAFIGPDVFIGPGAILTDDKHPVAGNKDYEANPAAVMGGASIGAGAILLPGVIVKHYARVGAGCIVTHDVLEHSVVYSKQTNIQK